MTLEMTPEQLEKRKIQRREKRRVQKEIIDPNKLTRYSKLHYTIRRKTKTHYKRVQYKDKIMQEIYNGWIKFNLIMEIEGFKYPTSITLKKNITALWLVMMDKIHCDHNRVIIDFIQNVCMKRWTGNTAKGMSDFVAKCMIHSMLDKEDYESFKMIYLSLNGRQRNHRKIVNPEYGTNSIRITVEKEAGDSVKSEKEDLNFKFKDPAESKKPLARKIKRTYIRKK